MTSARFRYSRLAIWRTTNFPLTSLVLAKKSITWLSVPGPVKVFPIFLPSVNFLSPMRGWTLATRTSRFLNLRPTLALLMTTTCLTDTGSLKDSCKAIQGKLSVFFVAQHGSLTFPSMQLFPSVPGPQTVDMKAVTGVILRSLGVLGKGLQEHPWLMRQWCSHARESVHPGHLVQQFFQSYLWNSRSSTVCTCSEGRGREDQEDPEAWVKGSFRWQWAQLKGFRLIFLSLLKMPNLQSQGPWLMPCLAL